MVWEKYSLEKVGKRHNLVWQSTIILFDILIKPILTYGCAVWGTGNYTDIETYHNKFLKRTLRVKSSTNTCLLYMETWRFLCTLCFYIKSNQIKIKIFISINNDDNNRYSTYKGNIVMCIIIHLHTFKYIFTHTYY